jgi:hypothetical protein
VTGSANRKSLIGMPGKIAHFMAGTCLFWSATRVHSGAHFECCKLKTLPGAVNKEMRYFLHFFGNNTVLGNDWGGTDVREPAPPFLAERHYFSGIGSVPIPGFSEFGWVAIDCRALYHTGGSTCSDCCLYWLF